MIRTRRQGFDETACSTIELWPRMLEPPGFEPGTSCLKACSSTGIRRENGLCALIFTCGSLGLVQTPLLFQPEQVRRSKHQASIFKQWGDKSGKSLSRVFTTAESDQLPLCSFVVFPAFTPYRYGDKLMRPTKIAETTAHDGLTLAV